MFEAITTGRGSTPSPRSRALSQTSAPASISARPAARAASRL